MSKSARINFGIPESEYIVQVDDTGAATSCYNQDTDTEYIGGGGGGDFSTAEVNVTVVPGDLIPLWIVALSEGYGEDEPPCVFTISVEDSETFIVPLYKGAQIMYSNFGPSITAYITDVEGDAELTENSLIITGDCSFTIDYSGAV